MGEKETYPGTTTTPEQLKGLAQEYARAAHLLTAMSTRGSHASRAPFRLSAIHAIELYLSAYLRSLGHEACEIRGMQHDLAQRTDLAVAKGLKLRAKTARHLQTLCQEREYVVARYDPGRLSQASHPTRLSASLLDVSRKVERHFGAVR